jgi:hypothetical protein
MRALMRDKSSLTTLLRWGFLWAMVGVPGVLVAACGHGSSSTSDSFLPALPTMTNVVVTAREDSVGIDFDP